MSAAVSLPVARPEQEREAEAVALLRVTIQLHERARLELDAAQDMLANAIDDAVEASESYARIGDMVLQASHLVVKLRGSR